MKTRFYQEQMVRVSSDAYIKALIKLKEAGITEDLSLTAKLESGDILDFEINNRNIHSCDILENVLESGTTEIANSIATVVIREVTQYKEFNKKLSEYVQMLEKSTLASITPMKLPEIHRSSVNGYALTLIDERGEEIINTPVSWSNPSLPEGTLSLLRGQDYRMNGVIGRIAGDLKYRTTIARNFLRTEVTPVQVLAVIKFLDSSEVRLPKTIENATILCILSDHLESAYSDSSLRAFAYGALNATTTAHMLAVKGERPILETYSFRGVDHIVVCDSEVDKVGDVELIFGAFTRDQHNIENYSVSTFSDDSNGFRTHFQAAEVNYHEDQLSNRKANLRRGIDNVFEDFIRSGLISATGFGQMEPEDIRIELYHVFNEIANSKEGLDSEFIMEHLFKRVLFAHTNFPVFMDVSTRYATKANNVNIGIAKAMQTIIAKFLVSRCVMS